MGLSPLRKAHVLLRAAEATLCWTNIPDAFLGSSVDIRVPCRQVDQSLQYGCFLVVLLGPNPHTLLPPVPWLCSSMEPIYKTWHSVSLELGCHLLWLWDHTHTDFLPALPETALSKLFAINGEAGGWEKGARPAFLPPSLQFLAPNLRPKSLQHHLLPCSCQFNG